MHTIAACFIIIEACRWTRTNSLHPSSVASEAGSPMIHLCTRRNLDLVVVKIKIRPEQYMIRVGFNGCSFTTWKVRAFLLRYFFVFLDELPSFSEVMIVTALMIPSAGFIPLLGLVKSLKIPVTSFISWDIIDLPLTSTVISLCKENN